MLQKIIATVVFVQDLDTCTAFYRDTLALQVQESDAVSTSFRLGDLYFMLLKTSEAAELLSVGADTLQRAGGPRWLLAASVADVDAVYATLTAKGVTFLRPPTDQHWGLRTAHFTDPEGNVWEINQPVVTK